MKYLKYTLIAVLALGTAPAFARGDGYNKTQEFYQRFRENQEKYHGKKSDEAQKASSADLKRSEPKEAQKSRSDSN
ncbi:hypothetical protein [Pseudomonas kuykendallii]|uniref:hypothetical protein n=1 Tax=Pseudomonas kuykendallii TaxID=1007099 RepID=UPI00289E054B|nr:hypothetical protein [Pseudomonas kuykendallii]